LSFWPCCTSNSVVAFGPVHRARGPNTAPLLSLVAVPFLHAQRQTTATRSISVHALLPPRETRARFAVGGEGPDRMQEAGQGVGRLAAAPSGVAQPEDGGSSGAQRRRAGRGGAERNAEVAAAREVSRLGTELARLGLLCRRGTRGRLRSSQMGDEGRRAVVSSCSRIRTFLALFTTPRVSAPPPFHLLFKPTRAPLTRQR